MSRPLHIRQQQSVAVAIIVSGPIQTSQLPLRLPDDRFLRNLITTGQRLDLHLYVLDVMTARPTATVVHNGYQLVDGQWQMGDCPLPSLIYDRAFSQRVRTKQLLQQLANFCSFTHVNGQLPGKLAVYAIVKQDAQLHHYLPSTLPFSTMPHLQKLLQRSPTGLFLKPEQGEQGRGSLQIVESDAFDYRWNVRGRTLRTNTAFHLINQTMAEMTTVLDPFLQRTSYLIQPNLALRNEHDEPTDCRCLVQKNAHGQWEVTGTVVRTGPHYSAIANLHGGGTAQPASQRLPSSVVEKVEQLSVHIAFLLEQSCGSLCELGIDFGYERHSQQLWLLEANAKPGRQSFAHDERQATIALQRPLQYMFYLAKRAQASQPFFAKV